MVVTQLKMKKIFYRAVNQDNQPAVNKRTGSWKTAISTDSQAHSAKAKTLILDSIHCSNCCQKIVNLNQLEDLDGAEELLNHLNLLVTKLPEPAEVEILVNK